MTNTTDPSATAHEHAPTLRLYFPQWQGAGVESIRELFSEVPLEEARRGYAVGTAVLGAVLPAHSGPTALVPVEFGDTGLGKQDGIEAKACNGGGRPHRSWRSGGAWPSACHP